VNTIYHETDDYIVRLSGSTNRWHRAWMLVLFHVYPVGGTDAWTNTRDREGSIIRQRQRFSLLSQQSMIIFFYYLLECMTSLSQNVKGLHDLLLEMANSASNRWQVSDLTEWHNQAVLRSYYDTMLLLIVTVPVRKLLENSDTFYIIIHKWV